jgi:hypothetical protein
MGFYENTHPNFKNIQENMGEKGAWFLKLFSHMNVKIKEVGFHPHHHSFW